ncbi:hypothetical protein F4679DRAFT_527879 [Xylaria curta]|nr:hypothetical protein F4679DRAFT_527879 [Xylaria curta]
MQPFPQASLPLAQLEAQLQAHLQAQLLEQLRVQLQAQLQASLQAQLQTQLQAQLQAQLQGQLDAQLQAQRQTQPEGEPQAAPRAEPQEEPLTQPQTTSQVLPQGGRPVQYIKLLEDALLSLLSNLTAPQLRNLIAKLPEGHRQELLKELQDGEQSGNGVHRQSNPVGNGKQQVQENVDEKTSEEKATKNESEQGEIDEEVPPNQDETSED